MYCLTSPVNLPANTGEYRFVHFNRNSCIFTYALHMYFVLKYHIYFLSQPYLFLICSYLWTNLSLNVLIKKERVFPQGDTGYTNRRPILTADGLSTISVYGISLVWLRLTQNRTLNESCLKFIKKTENTTDTI